MRVILSAMGRAFLRDGIVAFAVFGAGIWAAPDTAQAATIAVAASYAALAAAFRGVRVFVPQLSEQIAAKLGVPVAYAEVIITGLTTLLSGFVAGAVGFFEAPNFAEGKAAWVAAMLGVGTALFRLVQAFLTPGEPGPIGIETPRQPVPAEALAEPMPPEMPPGS